MIFLISLIFICISFGRAFASPRFAGDYRRHIEDIKRYGLSANYLSTESCEFENRRDSIRRSGIRSSTVYCQCDDLESAFKSSYFEFDECGRISRIVSFERDGKIGGIYAFRYDAAGRAIETAHLGPTGCVFQKHSKSFDDNGWIRQYSSFGPAETLMGMVEFLDRGDHIEEITYYRENDTKNTGILYFENGRIQKKIYDSPEDGEITENYIYRPDGNLEAVEAVTTLNEPILKWTYAYDAQDYPTEAVFHNPRRKAIYVRKLKYDHRQLLIDDESKMSSPEFASETRHAYRYDEQGNLVEKLFYSQNELQSAEIYRYDLDNKIINATEYSRDGRPEYQYIYTYSDRFTENIACDEASLANEAGDRKECFQNMATIEGAIELFFNRFKRPPDGLGELVEKKMLTRIPACRKCGTYSFVTAGGLLTVNCSLHGAFKAFN